MRTRAAYGDGRRSGSPAGARTPERHLDQRRARRRRRRAGSSRRAAAAWPRPAAAPATASGRAPRRRPPTGRTPVVRTGRDRPQRHGLAADPHPDRRRPVADVAARVAALDRRRSRAPSPTPGSSATTNTSTGPSSSLVPEQQVDRRPGPAGPVTGRHDAEVGHRPARAHRPRQVGREVDGRAEVLGELVVRHLRRRPQRPRSSPWIGHRVLPSCSTSARHRGHPATRVMRQPCGPRRTGRQEFQREDDRRLALVAEHREGRRVEPEEPALGDRQPEPARGQRAQRVSVPEDQRRAPVRRGAGRPRGRAARRPGRPSRRPGEGWVHTVQPGTSSRISAVVTALVVAVAPLDEVGVDLGVAEARELGRTPGPVPRAGEHQVEVARRPAAARSERATRSPSSVSGRSVVEVCRPDLLHSVSPCRTSQISAVGSLSGYSPSLIRGVWQPALRWSRLGEHHDPVARQRR